MRFVGKIFKIAAHKNGGAEFLACLIALGAAVYCFPHMQLIACRIATYIANIVRI
jgi:hypothetical protein